MHTAVASRGLTSLLVVLSTLGAIVVAAPAAADRTADRGVIHALERNARRLGRTSLVGQQLEAIRSGSTRILIRPGVPAYPGGPARGMISVERPWSRSGYFLGHDGRLAAADRKALGRTLARRAPKATGRGVLHTLRSAIGQHRKRQRTLREKADPTIDKLLGQIAALPANDRRGEIPLWSSRGAQLWYRPSAGVIVGSAGMSTKGFFLERTAPGAKPALRADSLQALRTFIADR